MLGCKRINAVLVDLGVATGSPGTCTVQNLLLTSVVPCQAVLSLEICCSELRQSSPALLTVSLWNCSDSDIVPCPLSEWPTKTPNGGFDCIIWDHVNPYLFEFGTYVTGGEANGTVTLVCLRRTSLAAEAPTHDSDLVQDKNLTFFSRRDLCLALVSFGRHVSPNKPPRHPPGLKAHYSVRRFPGEVRTYVWFLGSFGGYFETACIRKCSERTNVHPSPPFNTRLWIPVSTVSSSSFIALKNNLFRMCSSH